MPPAVNQTCTKICTRKHPTVLHTRAEWPAHLLRARRRETTRGAARSRPASPRSRAPGPSRQGNCTRCAHLHDRPRHQVHVSKEKTGGAAAPTTGGREAPRRARMTGKQRREQLLDIGRRLFAEKGFDGTSIEEIASAANVSKPVVYEHFGGKEGLYAVVVDREVHKLLEAITHALTTNAGPRALLEQATLAFLDYVEASTDGFRILVRDSPVAQSTGTFSSLINDIASQVEHLLAREFRLRELDPNMASLYSQMLVGMVALTGQHWLDSRRPRKAVVAAHLVNLAWNGLSGLEREPETIEQRRLLPRDATVTVYVDTEDQLAAERAFQAVDRLADALGLSEVTVTELIRGSFFRRARARIGEALDSRDFRERLAQIERGFELAQLDLRQSEVDQRTAAALKDVLESVEPIPRACIRIGSLLIAKYPDGAGAPVLLVRQLSQKDIAAIDRYPELQGNPEKILSLLSMIAPESLSVDGPFDEPPGAA
jgi:AcrR family transcriptional regulator